VADRKLSVDIVATTATLWRGEAEFVTAPTPEGSIGVYPMHQPLLSVLGEGEVRIQVAGERWLTCQVSGGFLSVDSDTVTVVTDTGEVGQLPS
jgi:F-type H+-transporting ATPase subunit epsilon